jgi:hypothetical protein
MTGRPFAKKKNAQISPGRKRPPHGSLQRESERLSEFVFSWLAFGKVYLIKYILHYYIMYFSCQAIFIDLLQKIHYHENMKKQKETYSVRLTPSLVKEAKLLCVYQERPFSDVIEEGIREVLEKYEKSSTDKVKRKP